MFIYRILYLRTRFDSNGNHGNHGVTKRVVTILKEEDTSNSKIKEDI